MNPYLGIIFAALLCGCVPHGVSQELVDVTGEFREDGTCDAHTPKGSLGTRQTVGQADYQIGRALNVARRGFTLHTIVCAFPGDGVTPLASNRRITIMLGVRDKQPLRRGHYDVWPLGVQDTTGSQASLSVKHPAYDVGTPGSGHGGEGGHISLRGVSGSLDLVRVDSNSVIARFAIRARREWSM